MLNFKERTLTSFNVSVGTGLALESLFEPIAPRYDTTRDIPNKIKLDKYDYHLFNLMTLVRNIAGSLPDRVPFDVVVKDKLFLSTLENEINQMNSLYINTNCKLGFFYQDYPKVVEVYNKGKDRELTKVIDNFTTLYEKINKINFDNMLTDVPIFKNILKLDKFPTKKKILMTTSFMSDLFYKGDYDLLESHTGVLLEKDKWYKKYYQIGTKDMSVFPIREILLYYIGDKVTSAIISPKTRALIYNLAIEHRWNKYTSEDSIKNHIRRVPELSIHLKNYKRLFT